MLETFYEYGSSRGEQAWSGRFVFKALLRCRTVWPVLGLLFGTLGCHSVPRLAPVNLKEGGWTVREGQGVWQAKKGREVAGEILLATSKDGRAFVQFSKNPFPLIIAQSTTNTWEVEIPTQNKRYSGRGLPPARLTWLYLPRVLSGQPPPKGWSWKTLENNGGRLENRAKGFPAQWDPKLGIHVT